MTDLEKFKAAKESYYNSGKEIMSDAEYDALEKKLGLENKSYIGTLHNESYTIKHPLIMGSLSKVQVKETKDINNNIFTDYNDFANQALKYLNHYNNNEKKLIITPKYDGCSFELVINNNYNKNNHIVSCSTRGDGEYGKDMYEKLKDKFDTVFINKVIKRINNIYNINNKNIILRGECLVDKLTFENKYINDFVNPRAFVAGTLNRDYNNKDKKLLDQLNDIDCIIYDIRIETDNNIYKEIDFEDIRNSFDIKEEYKYVKMFPSIYVVTYDSTITLIDNFNLIYNKYNHIRSIYNYALDGFVIKPTCKYRHSNNTETRPKDCIAIKFKPMIARTSVKNIEWTVGKKNELTPILILNEIKLDGKSITRVSAHNYGYIKDNNIAIGTVLDISLAGDIIPFIYNICDNKNNIYNDTNIISFNNYNNNEINIDGVHAYLIENETEHNKRLFEQRTLTLGIKSLGKKNIEKLSNYIYNKLNENNTTDDFLNINENNNDINNNINNKTFPMHIFCVNYNDIENAIGGKTATIIINNIESIKSKISLSEIIKSCCFSDCGERVSDTCAKYLTGEQVDWFGLNKDAYKWVFEKESNEHKILNEVLNACNKNISYFKTLNEQNNISNNISNNKTFVILTGEPNNYNSKSDFLKQHPQYEVTGSWKKVQIVFTNDLNSNTGKMKKAHSNNIEIRLY